MLVCYTHTHIYIITACEAQLTKALDTQAVAYCQ